ncbi:MAG: histidine--tRNA ligase [Actinomycetota bacterium]|nr:histidine--tRNA ligase [Actinomycetota bacterium]
MTPETTPPSGTRDFLAAEVERRRRAFELVQVVFRRFGFEPLETPAFERLEVLLGKYGEEGDKLIFKLLRRGEREEAGEVDLALRYDLTVPLARVVAQHSDRIVQPYKRFHIGPVWRADRPGKGRYREFTQCDVDIIGSRSSVADAEAILAVTAALAALGLSDFTVLLNSRQTLRGVMEAYGVPAELEDTTLTALDKFDKVGVEGVVEELRERGVPPHTTEAIGDDLDEGPEKVRDLLESTDQGRAGLAEVDEVAALVRPHLPAGQLRVAPLLARGLNYYTGPIFEVRAAGLGSSIASGGRYDNLIGMLSNRDIPACGGSVGLERVLLLLEGQEEPSTGPDVLVTVLDEGARGDAMKVASMLRGGGLDVDLYVGDGRLGKQLRYADRRAIRFCIIRGGEEQAAATAAVKDLDSGVQVAVPLDDLAGHLHGLLRPGGKERTGT